MAIFSLNHKAIGKASQDKPFTAAAHIRYITRSAACRDVMSNRMPTDPRKAEKWFKDAERADRKNARVCDKVMIAIPRELSKEERTALVNDFAERVTQGKAPWFAAIHDKGKDAKNPHCHLVFRDRDERAKRCLFMSAGKAERALLKEKGIDAMTTSRMREMWEHAANEHLERSGHRERIDHRSLEAQGIQREPTIHEGAKLRKMVSRGKKPVSKECEISNHTTAKSAHRSVDFQAIDKGKTRQERNREIYREAGLMRIKEARERKNITLVGRREKERESDLSRAPYDD